MSESSSQRTSSPDPRGAGAADRPLFASIRGTIGRLPQLLPLTLTLSETGEEEVALWGEVLEIRRGWARHYLTMLDAKQDDVAVCASLPSACELPEIGDVVAVLGRFVPLVNGSTVEIQFEGSCVQEKTDRPQRRGEQQRLLSELRQRWPSPRKIKNGVRQVRVVTSRESKAVADFFHGLGRWERTGAGVEVVPVHLREAESIANGIREAAAEGVDLVVVTRGGGSPVDLMPFNSASVMRAVAEVTSRVPVLVAVGHHEDQTLADQLASHVESTPSSAGRFVAKMMWAGSASAPPAPALPETVATPTAPHTVQVTIEVAAPRAPSSKRHGWPGRLVRRLVSVVALLLLAAATFGAGWVGHVYWETRTASQGRGTSPHATTPSKGAVHRR